jgi:hypothetical protein
MLSILQFRVFSQKQFSHRTLCVCLEGEKQSYTHTQTRRTRVNTNTHRLPTPTIPSRVLFPATTRTLKAHTRAEPIPVTLTARRRCRGATGAGRSVAVQIENLKKQTLKPGFHVIGSRVETGRFQAMGHIWILNLYSPPPWLSGGTFSVVPRPSTNGIFPCGDNRTTAGGCNHGSPSTCT